MKKYEDIHAKLSEKPNALAKNTNDYKAIIVKTKIF